MEKEKVTQRYNTYKSDPNAWRWIKEHEKDEQFGEWTRVVAQHFEKNLLNRLKDSNENLIEIFQSQFLWGQGVGYQSGMANNRVYQVKHGTFATGYFCLTDRNIYIAVFAKLTKKHPLIEKPSFVNRFLLGMLGERDEREDFPKDGFWPVSLKSIQDVQIATPEENVECITLTTGSNIWNLYVADNLSFTLTAINMARFGEFESIHKRTISEAQNKPTNDATVKLQELKKLLTANLITQNEYDSKRQDILSRL